jgi:hypothetical protein
VYDLVPHGGYDGNLKGKHSSHDGLFVETPEILNNRAPSSQDDDVGSRSYRDRFFAPLTGDPTDIQPNELIEIQIGKERLNMPAGVA